MMENIWGQRSRSQGQRVVYSAQSW